VRPSNTTQEMTDYYLVAGLRFLGHAEVLRDTTMDLDTAYYKEKHFNRPDLDDTENPLGRISLATKSEFGRFHLRLNAAAEQTYGEQVDVYVPGGVTNKTRDVTETISYGGELSWQRRSLTLAASYDFTSDRHQDAFYQAGDQDETTVRFFGDWVFWKEASISYEYELVQTDLVNQPESDKTWEVTQRILLNWRFPLLKRPQLTYSLGVEKEDTDTETGTWDLIHILTLSDSWALSPTLRLSVDGTYEYDQKPDADDVPLRYGVRLRHEISATAQQELTATREETATLGSSKGTDTRNIGYTFTKRDLFMYNLNLLFSATYGWDAPLESSAETEITWTYEASLRYSRLVTRRLSRTLAYEYSDEISNLADEPLEEHRVTLTYTYTF
jgi:hypothetical protein